MVRISREVYLRRATHFAVMCAQLQRADVRSSQRVCPVGRHRPHHSVIHSLHPELQVARNIALVSLPGVHHSNRRNVRTQRIQRGTYKHGHVHLERHHFFQLVDVQHEADCL